jgi:uncharacterized membrane protein YhaH (DUF805 family)
MTNTAVENSFFKSNLDFSGRIGRKTFWKNIVLNIIFALFIGFLLNLLMDV